MSSDFLKSSSPPKRTKKRTGSASRDSLDSYQRNSNNTDVSGGNALGAPIPAPCKAAKYLLSGSQDADGLHPHYKTFCKSYRCEYCGPKKVFLIRRAIELAMEKYDLRVFATLTLDPKTCGCQPEDSVKYIRNVWNKFRILQKRKFGRSLDFISIIEFQKNGFAHLHVLFNLYQDHKWVKAAWSSVGGGSIVDIRKSDRGAPSYLSKYLAKEMLTRQKQKARGYTASQSIKLMKLVRSVLGVAGRPKFKFVKVDEATGRDILDSYIVGDILDRKNFITGFQATRQLGGSEETPTLRNVRETEGSSS